MSDKINEIVQTLRRKERKPNHKEEMEQIAKIKKEITEKQSKNERISLKIIADLYIGDFDGGSFFAEIKSPLPNLDICTQSKLKILIFETLLMKKTQEAIWLSHIIRILRANHISTVSPNKSWICKWRF